MGNNRDFMTMLANRFSDKMQWFLRVPGSAKIINVPNTVVDLEPLLDLFVPGRSFD